MLQNEAIRLRALEPADADILYQWENNPKVWKVSHTLTPFSKKVLQDYVQSVQDIYADRQLRLMICLPESDKPIGTIDLFEFEPFHQRAGVGILIAADEHRRQGYAEAALRLLIDYGFNTLQLQQLYANIAVSNAVSIGLFEKCGFNITGTKKEWIRRSPDDWEDEHTLQYLRKNWLADQ